MQQQLSTSSSSSILCLSFLLYLLSELSIILTPLLTDERAMPYECTHDAIYFPSPVAAYC